MITHRTGATIVAALSVAVLLGLPAPAGAQSSSTFIIPFERSGPPDLDDFGNPIPNTGGLFNPCTLELVDVLGVSTIKVTQSLVGSTLKTNVSAVTKGTGTGQLTAIVYPFYETQQFLMKTVLGQVVESEFVDKLSMKGPQSIDNWIVRARFRIKLGPTGAVQIDLIRVNDGDQCKG
jgi:hypothetical protein